MVRFYEIRALGVELDRRRIFVYSEQKKLDISLLYFQIFPATMKEFGIASSEFLQIFFQINDYSHLDYTPTYHPYNLIRLSVVALGLGLTYLYMPETKDLTLVQTQQLGVQFEQPVLHIIYSKDEDVGDADVI